MQTHQPWLFVDLDRTLIQTDLLEEQWTGLLLRRPVLAISLMMLALFKGRPWFKTQLAKHATIIPEHLPYNPAVLHAINGARNKNCKIGLVSASHHQWVEAISIHLGLFDFIAGSQSTNLKGSKKIQIFNEVCPSGNWEYLGDSIADLPIWRASQGGMAINPSWWLRWRLTELKAKIKIHKTSRSLPLLKLIRPHQWSKNVLVFVAPFAAHSLFSLRLLQGRQLAFFASVPLPLLFT